MISRRHLWTAALLVSVLLAVVAQPVPAAEKKDYAYLLIQGKLNSSRDGRPVDGARVRLDSGKETFEAVTDFRGFFSFQRLPVGTYDIEIVTSQGKVIHRARRVDTADLGLNLLDLKFGESHRRRGDSGVKIDAAEGERVKVEVPEIGTRWDRFRNELFVFLGLAVVLGL